MAQTGEDLPTLVAQTGPLNGQRWRINRILTIGRDNDCDIVIPSRQVSRLHAQITIVDDHITLEDLESKNGTHWNGKLIESKVPLQDGDIIQIAFAQQFTFISSDATLPLENAGLQMQGLGSTKRRLHLDTRAHRVYILDHEVIPTLSAAQFNLLEVLFQQAGQVVSRNQLIQTVWQDEDAIGVSEQALDALIRRLRDRLAAFDPSHNYITTIRGHGIRLDNPAIE